jgi:hypothetical protein
MVYLLLEGSFTSTHDKWQEIQMNIQKSSSLETTEAAGTSQTRLNKIVNALLQMK